MGSLAEDVIAAKQLRDQLYALEKDIARKSQMRPITQKDEQEMRGYQARADAVYQASGRRAPEYLPLEQPYEYRRRLLKPLQACSDKWNNVNLDKVDDAIIDNLEADLFEAAKADALSPRDLRPGEMREITNRDEKTGHITTKFVGKDTHFVRQFTRPARRVKLLDWTQYMAMSSSRRA